MEVHRSMPPSNKAKIDQVKAAFNQLKIVLLNNCPHNDLRNLALDDLYNCETSALESLKETSNV